MRFTRAAVVFEGLTLVAAGALVAAAITNLPTSSQTAGPDTLPAATSTEGNYAIGPSGVFYKGARVPGADAGSFTVPSASGFEDVGRDNQHFFYGTTTLGSVADFTYIPAPTFSTSSERFAVQVVQRQALRFSGCTSIQPTGSCAARISIDYPQIIGTTSPAISRINAQITREYEKEFSSAVAEGKQQPDTADTNGYQEDVTFNGLYAPQKYPFVTFSFYGWEYFPGAVNGTGDYYDETYDLTTGSPVTPKNLFVVGSDYQLKIDAYVDEVLINQELTNTASSTDGLDCLPWPSDPSPSFPSDIVGTDVYVADAGVAVVNQGSTYPCSGDEFDVVVPFSALKGDLSPSGVLHS